MASRVLRAVALTAVLPALSSLGVPSIAQLAALGPAAAAANGGGAPGVLALPSGIVWAYNGAQVMRSRDAGVSWHEVLPTWPQSPTALQVMGAFFLDREDAWAFTEHQWPAPPGVTTVWRTTDGGRSWQKGTSLPGAALSSYGSVLGQLAFADTAHGYGFGVADSGELGYQGALWATSDGGSAWQRVSASGLPWGTGAPSLYNGNCPGQVGFSLNAAPAGVLLLSAACPRRVPGRWRSADGGRVWGPAQLPAPPAGWAAAEAWADSPRSLAGAEVMGTRFFHDGQGVAAVSTRPGSLLVYRSTDSGISWRLASHLETGSLSRPSGFSASSPASWELPAPAGLYVTSDGGQHWRLQRSGLSLPNMAEASFASGRTGIGLSTTINGSSGLRTVDGGRSWQPVSLPAPGAGTPEPAFSTVDFADRLDGWVGGADGVEASTNGGESWARQLATAAPVEQLSFADADHGWALTADQLFATSDGGRHWAVVQGTAMGAFSWAQLVTPGFGVALVCGTGGTRALASSNEGRSWHLLALPRPNGAPCGRGDPLPGPLYGLCFGTPASGWAIALGRGSAATVLERTDDGGRHWSPVASLWGAISALACQGTGQAWLGFVWMANNTLLGDLAGTLDGGASWRIGKFGPSPFNTPRLAPSARRPRT